MSNDPVGHSGATVAGARTGEQYRTGLRERPREVWLNGERVTDVTAHPALRRPLARISALYDLQHDPDHRDLLTVTDDDGRTPRAFEPPRSPEQLRLRREAFRVRAEACFGLLGRMPEFAHTTLLGFAQSPELFASLGSQFADNITSYLAYVRTGDLFVAPALSPLPIDRSLPLSAPEQTGSQLAVVAQTSEGLVVRGARMISTPAPLADELLIYHPPTLRPGDDAHAAVFAVATDTPGLRMICRQPFDDGRTDPAAHPLAAHFEEPDALVVFDDVVVPWKRVFLHGCVRSANALHRAGIMRELVGQQMGVRSLVRMELIVGVAMKLADAINVAGQLHVQQRLGEAVSVVEQARALLVAAEVECETAPSGVVYPTLSYLGALRVLVAKEFPKLVELLEVLGAGGLMMRPGPGDVTGERAVDIDRYCRGAAGTSAADRIALLNLAWDLSGTEFGRRGVQFERYGGGDPVRVTAGTYLGYNTRPCLDLVDRALAFARE